MQILVNGPVGPGEPDETKDDGKLAKRSPGDVIRQGVGRLRDEDDIDEVAEKLDENDGPPDDRIAVGAVTTTNSCEY